MQEEKRNEYLRNTFSATPQQTSWEKPVLTHKTYEATDGSPHEDWDGRNFVVCFQPILPITVDKIVADIMNYADAHKIYRFRTGSTVQEYPVAFPGVGAQNALCPFWFYTMAALYTPASRQMLAACFERETVILNASGQSKRNKVPSHEVRFTVSGKVEPQDGRLVKVYGDMVTPDGKLLTKTSRRHGRPMRIQKVESVDLPPCV